jgi:hypothetical protein
MKYTTAFKTILLAALLGAISINAAAQATTVPLYKLYSSATGAHFYTVDTTRKAEAMAAGWSSQGIETYVLGSPIQGSVPMYILVMPLRFGSGRGHVFSYTTNVYENDTLRKSAAVPSAAGGEYEFLSKWTNDAIGIAAYVSPNQLPGTVPLYRLRHPPQSSDKLSVPHSYDTFLTTDEKQQAFYIKSRGYRFIDIVGYVWPAAGEVSLDSNTVPKIKVTATNVNPDTELLNRGCTRTALGSYECSNAAANELCASYKKAGKVKNCYQKGNFSSEQYALDQELFKIGCNRFLGRPDEYICKTQNALNLCEARRQAGKVKKCYAAKQ